MFLGVKCGGCVGLTALPPSVSRLSRQCVILNISQPYRPPRPVTGIALLFFSPFKFYVISFFRIVEIIKNIKLQLLVEIQVVGCPVAHPATVSIFCANSLLWQSMEAIRDSFQLVSCTVTPPITSRDFRFSWHYVRTIRSFRM
jgi:hypothetical protein